MPFDRAYVLQHVLMSLLRKNNYLILNSFTFPLTYQCQDQRVQHRDYSRRLPYVKEISQKDELEDWRVSGMVERKLHLYRKFPGSSAGGHCAMTQAAARKVKDSTQTIQGHHSFGTSMRQISLSCHHTCVRIRGSVVPVVIHRVQDIGEYSAIDLTRFL